MPTPKELREKRAKIASEMRRLVDEDKTTDASGNYTEAWTRANADYDRLTRQIETEEAAERAVAEQVARLGDGQIGRGNHDGRTALTSERDRVSALAIAGWLAAYRESGLSEEQRAACSAVGLNPYSKGFRIQLYGTADAQRLQRQFRSTHPTRAREALAGFRADLSMGSGSAGGYIQAPETLRTELEINMLAFGGVRQVAETIRTATGEPMSWPTADDTSNTGAQLGENTSIGSSTDPTFGKVSWSAYKFSSKPILVPYELIQDAVINLPQILGQMMGERLGRITNTKFTTGTGAATAKGIVTCATTFSAASATAIAWDDVLGLEHSVDPAYRLGAGYMCHDSIMLALRKLKDGNGMPIWQSNWNAGQPDTLNARPITNNQDMASSIASGNKTLLFGELVRYKIRSVGEARIYRLEERYRDTDQDGFIAFIREDGNLLTSTTAPVKVLTH